MNICANMNQEQRRAFISQIPVEAARARQCEHIKANGEFCGSPALRGRHHCYFHLTHIGRRLRAERAHAAAQSSEANTPLLELPPFEDANSIQIALMQVVDAILHNRLDNKRAGLVLYALQTASSNLAHGADFAQMQGATVAGRYDDFEQDFRLDADVAELQADEVEEVKEEDDAHAAELARIEELAEAYAKLDSAREEAGNKIGAKVAAGADVEEEEARLAALDECPPEFQCHHMDRFFCRLMGPLSQAHGSTTQSPRTRERDARRQRIESLELERKKAA